MGPRSREGGASWDALGVSPTLKGSLESAGFHTPTPIQAMTFASLSEGQSVAFSAETGSGKTIAYLLPLLQWLEGLGDAAWRDTTSPLAIVLVPTQELVLQVSQVISDVFPSFYPHVGLAYAAKAPPRRHKCAVLISTPQALNEVSRGPPPTSPYCSDIAPFLQSIPLLPSSASLPIPPCGPCGPCRAAQNIAERRLNEVRKIVIDEADMLLSGHYAGHVESGVVRIACALARW